MSELEGQIKKEVLRLHEDTEHTFKAHFVSAERWEKLNLRLGISSIILSVTAGSLALSKIVPHFDIFAGITGFAAAALTALLSFLKPRDKYEIHTRFGNKYLSLRNDLRRFSNIELLGNPTEDELKTMLDKFITEKKALDTDSPLLPNWAYTEAKKRIEAGETVYMVDKNVKK